MRNLLLRSMHDGAGAMVALAMSLILAFASPARAATPVQIDASRDAALAWLIQQQRGDGSWRGQPGNSVQATASGLQAMERAGVYGYVHSRGLSWLSNAVALSVDGVARQALVLHGAGLNAQVQRDTLLSWRNRLKGWGAYERYETSFPDTPLAMSALRADASTYQAEKNRLLNGLCQILLAQKSGGADAAGDFVPGPGTVVAVLSDLFNAGMSAGRGDKLGASMSLAAAIPYLDIAATVGKYGVKGADIISDATTGAGKWSRALKSIQDQMTLAAAKKGVGIELDGVGVLSDPKVKGIEKWEYRVRSKNSQDSVIHYVRDPKTKNLMDFKVKKHSTH